MNLAPHRHRRDRARSIARVIVPLLGFGLALWCWGCAAVNFWAADTTNIPANKATWLFWGKCFSIAVPLLVVLSGASIYWLRPRTRSPHACPACDYNRTGLAAGAVCPECGASAPW